MNWMTFWHWRVLITWSACCILIMALAATASASSGITEITLPAQLVSGDGSVVTGTWPWLENASEDPGDSPFRWTKKEQLVVLSGLAESDVDTNAINYDGTVIVGSARCAEGGMCSHLPMMMRWTDSLGWEPMLLEVDGLIANGEATAVSDDGSVVVGKLGLYDHPSSRLFIWKEASGIAELDLPPQGCIDWGYPLISGDGQTVVVGCYPGSQDSPFFKWTEQQGYEQLEFGYPIDISTDGGTIVGVTNDGNAFRYNEAAGLQEIGQFSPSAASADCSIIVGHDVVWDEINGLQPIEDYLESKGVDLRTESWIVSSATDISDDGTVFVGSGYNNIGTIIDNKDTGFHSGPNEWPWSQYTPGGYNTSYQFAPPGNGAQWATWTFYPRFFGSYEILAQWTSADNRAPDAAYSVDIPYTANGRYVVDVDQTKNGGVFNSLGIYENNEFFSTQVPFEITLADTPSGYVIADAVKIVFQDRGWMAKIDEGSDPAPQPTELIIDDNGSGFSSGPNGWRNSRFTPGGFNGSYQYAPPGNGNKWAIWTFTLEASGNFEVFAQWTSSGNRSKAAPYTIINNRTQIPVTVDQTINGGRFISLGAYWLESGTVEIVLNDSPSGYVIADAVKLVSSKSNGAMQVTIDNVDPNFSVTGAWRASDFIPGYYASNYMYALPNSDSRLAKWSFSIPRSANYEISARWTASDNRSLEAPYTIVNNSATVGETTTDQSHNGGRFVPIGSYWLEAGTADVLLSGTPTRCVIADAVRITEQ